MRKNSEKWTAQADVNVALSAQERRFEASAVKGSSERVVQALVLSFKARLYKVHEPKRKARFVHVCLRIPPDSFGGRMLIFEKTSESQEKI
jgi:hypothetical protein